MSLKHRKQNINTAATATDDITFGIRVCKKEIDSLRIYLDHWRFKANFEALLAQSIHALTALRAVGNEYWNWNHFFFLLLFNYSIPTPLWYLSKLKKKTFHLSRLSKFCNSCHGKWVWVRETCHLTCQVTVNKILAESWAQNFTVYSVVAKFIGGTYVLKWVICKSTARLWIQNCKNFCRTTS